MRKQNAIDRIKSAFCRDTFYTGKDPAKPGTVKQLAEWLYVDKRAPGFRRMAAERGQYVEGHFSFKIPDNKKGGTLVAAITGSDTWGTSADDKSLDLMSNALDKIHAENTDAPVTNSILGVNDAERYLLQNTDGKRTRVNGEFYETVRQWTRADVVRFRASDRPITFWDSANKLVGAVMPIADDGLSNRTPVDVAALPVFDVAERWTRLGFTVSGAVVSEVAEPGTRVKPAAGWFVDMLSGGSAPFQVSRDGDGCYELYVGRQTETNPSAVGVFGDKSDALAAAAALALRIHGVDANGDLHFNFETKGEK